MTRGILLGLALGAVSCATIGDPGSFPDELPNGGTGLFRVLDAFKLDAVEINLRAKGDG